MTGRVSGKTAVVTGGASGIGEATCRRFAEEGADVAVVDWDGEAARETAESIESETDSAAVAVETDVGDEDAVAAMAETVDERFGGVDVLVNNAGIRVDPGPVTEADGADIDRILAVNQKGVAFCVKHLAPLMDEGSIVNVSSVGAAAAREGWSLYDGTKGAIEAMTRDMACDFVSDGIRVNAVSPGWVITDYHLPDDPDEAETFFREKTRPHADGPGILKRAAEPREIANAILFLASEEASFVTGSVLDADGGLGAVGMDFDWDTEES